MELCPAEVKRLRSEHRAKVGPWVDDRVRRKQVGQKDPIADFLFEYYSFPPAKLLRWSPGLTAILLETKPEEMDDAKHFVALPNGCTLDPGRFPEHRIPYLHWAISYLEAVQQREPYFGCFGLHEWAMVYRTDEVRHDRIPLRLGREGSNAIVESRPVNCSHYDAFRFFTPQAKPLNRTELTRQNSIDHDQPACIHAIMDLYKFCYKISPYCKSELLADAFLLGAECRVLDMRASPYDLTSHSLMPIRIETREGRDEYVAEQSRLADAGCNLRDRVLAEYRTLLERCEGKVGKSEAARLASRD